MINKETLWLGVGFLGQFFFSMRFFVQWIMTEKNKKSVIPITFWYFSLMGGLTLFIYAVYRKDPVFIVGQGFGILIYIRNLHFIYKKPKNIGA